MDIYIYLVIFVLLLDLFIPKGERRNGIIVTLTSLYLFAIYILRDFNVGVDIPGYLYAYENVTSKDYYETYLENGYVYSMELFNSLGFTFRGFIFVIYLLFLVPFSRFLKRYSQDATLSLMIFICYNFLVFTMSGLRQSIATSICLVAFMVAQRKDRKSFLIYCGLILLAILFHKSSFIFAPAYFIMRTTLNKKWAIIYGILAVVAIIVREPLVAYMNATNLSPYQIEDNLTIGSTFFLTLFATISAFYLSSRGKENQTPDSTDIIHLSLNNFVNLMVISLLIKLVFSGTIMMRAAMYYEMFIMLMIPNMLKCMNKGMATFIRISIISLLILVFVVTVLIPKQFDVVPYIFATNLNLFK